MTSVPWVGIRLEGVWASLTHRESTAIGDLSRRRHTQGGRNESTEDSQWEVYVSVALASKFFHTFIHTVGFHDETQTLGLSTQSSRILYLGDRVCIRLLVSRNLQEGLWPTQISRTARSYGRFLTNFLSSLSSSWLRLAFFITAMLRTPSEMECTIPLLHATFTIILNQIQSLATSQLSHLYSKLSNPKK